MIILLSLLNTCTFVSYVATLNVKIILNVKKITLRVNDLPLM